MQNFLKVGSNRLLCTAAVAILLSATTYKAKAHPPFLPLFNKQYKHLAEQAKQAKCIVCHRKKDNKDKKRFNNYGRALERVIEKNKGKIVNIFEKVEGERSAIKGKTFGDLIKEGKLPASTE